MTKQIRGGLYPALVTPFDSRGQVDEGALRALIDMQLHDGADGFYLTGSTGECHLLTMQERKRIVEVAAKHIAGRAVVVVHVGTPGTGLSVELGRHGLEHGADALSAVPPFYYRYGFEEIRAHYEAIVEATSLPMIVYNFPALSGVHFTLDNIRAFAENPKIIGIKHTSPDLYQMERIIRAVPRFTLFNGHDEIFLAGLSMGAHGAIGSTFNFMLPKVRRVWELYKANKMAEALAEQRSVNDVIDAILSAGNYPATKYLLEKRGIPCGGCRAPMGSLSMEGKMKLDEIFPRLAPL